MSTRELYNQWSASYDEVVNPTRDLEKLAGMQMLQSVSAGAIIELGCGTGKNTAWLAEKAGHLTAVDFSNEMLALARAKVKNGNVVFQQADITGDWEFTQRKADLVTCSLVLEHIAALDPLFKKVKDHLKEEGIFYVCELHPFKQYNGSKARFNTSQGEQVLECFTHHISDYLSAAAGAGLSLVELREWFDEDNAGSVPRLISFIFGRP